MSDAPPTLLHQVKVGVDLSGSVYQERSEAVIDPLQFTCVRTLILIGANKTAAPIFPKVRWSLVWKQRRGD